MLESLYGWVGTDSAGVSIGVVGWILTVLESLYGWVGTDSAGVSVRVGGY